MGLEAVAKTGFLGGRKYQRLGSERQSRRSGRRSVRLVDPGKQRRQRWGVRTGKRLRLRRLLRRIGIGSAGILSAPRLLLRRARDSYVRMMVSLSGKRDNAGLVSMGHTVMSGGGAAFAKPLQNTVMSNKDLDRLLRRAISQRRFESSM